MLTASPRKRNTLSDLARKAGCSANTVSLALRESPIISPPVRERIQLLARKQGYRPNPLVTALMQSRRRSRSEPTIAVLTKFGAPLARLASPPQSAVRLLAGMRARAAALGHRLEEFPCAAPHAPDGEQLTHVLRRRGIRGVVLFPGGDTALRLPVLAWHHFSVVAAACRDDHATMHRTAFDRNHDMKLCLEKLTALGHRRIGLALTRALDPHDNYAASGRYLTWQSRQPAADRVPLVPGDGAHPAPADFVTWALHHRPDAIIVHTDTCLDLLEDLVRTRGLRTLPVTFHCSPRDDLAGLRLRFEDLGATSIGLLLWELSLNHYGLPPDPELTEIGSTWREGHGLSAPAPSAVSSVGDSPS